MHYAKKAPSLLLISLGILSREQHVLEQVFGRPLCFGFPSNDPKKGLYRGPEKNCRLSLLILVLDK